MARFWPTFALVCCWTVAAVLGTPGSTRQCEVVSITGTYDKGYTAIFSTSAPDDYTSLELFVQFNHPARYFNMESIQVDITQEDDSSFTARYSKAGSAGDLVEFSFRAEYDGPQALMGVAVLNGVDVCGAGGGATTHTPMANPCAESGTSPYDYPQLLCMSVLFYEAQRSGAIPSDQRVTWRWDSALDDGQDVGHDLSGGYYDAGDHVKFGFPLAYSATVLAWGVIEYQQGFEAAGELEHGRQAVKWATDYLLKAHTASTELWGQVGAGGIDHGYWGRPEEMEMERPSDKIDQAEPGSELAGETAAALAAASIVFADDSQYSAECLAAAVDLYNFANDYRGIYTSAIGDAGGFYGSFSGYGDELTWAALWLYKATGDASYLTAAKAHWDEFEIGGGAVQFGWDDKRAGCYALFSELDGGSVYTTALQTFVDWVINEATYTPMGLVHLDQWGALRHAMNVAYIAMRAADLGIDPSNYRAWVMGQLDYVLGSTGRSFVVGYGDNPPTRPHHRSSSCPQYPSACFGQSWPQYQEGPNPHVLYGALVGGPDTDDSYVDDRNDYVHNEVACDYNAAFVGVLAAVVQNQL